MSKDNPNLDKADHVVDAHNPDHEDPHKTTRAETPAKDDPTPVKTKLEPPPAGSYYEKSVAEHNAEVDQKSQDENKHYKKD